MAAAGAAKRADASSVDVMLSQIYLSHGGVAAAMPRAALPLALARERGPAPTGVPALVRCRRWQAALVAQLGTELGVARSSSSLSSSAAAAAAVAAPDESPASPGAKAVGREAAVRGLQKQLGPADYSRFFAPLLASIRASSSASPADAAIAGFLPTIMAAVAQGAGAGDDVEDGKARVRVDTSALRFLSAAFAMQQLAGVLVAARALLAGDREDFASLMYRARHVLECLIVGPEEDGVAGAPGEVVDAAPEPASPFPPTLLSAAARAALACTSLSEVHRCVLWILGAVDAWASEYLHGCALLECDPDGEVTHVRVPPASSRRSRARACVRAQQVVLSPLGANPTEVVLELLLSIVELLASAVQRARRGSSEAAFASVALKCALRTLHANLVAASMDSGPPPVGLERTHAPVAPSPLVCGMAGAPQLVPALVGGALDGGASERFEKYVRSPCGGLYGRISSALVDCATWKARSFAVAAGAPAQAAAAAGDMSGDPGASGGPPIAEDVVVGVEVKGFERAELQNAAAQAWGSGLTVVLPTPVRRSMLFAELLAAHDRVPGVDRDAWSMLFVAACQRLSRRDVASAALPSHIPLSSSVNSDLRLGGARATQVRAPPRTPRRAVCLTLLLRSVI